ncbi:carbohydrate ABC transporter permease [Ruania halotolerans]|uniref:carbohydrate ABC transporter permease n=1 Tax=Ruania halotolerans TaxID=2897773 RepID=UPI001E45B9FC|nr:carbohydrate ABC transporter permease [Ruania halotolerans]UFU06360.1 carbohydrate ABC transporter permease [Ruania halotolerans]
MSTSTRTQVRFPHGDVPRRPRGRRRGWAAVVAYVVTALLILPMLWVVVLSFQTNENILRDPLNLTELNLANYEVATQTLNLMLMYKNTFILASVSVVVGVVFAYMAAYALTRMEWTRVWLRNGLRFYLLAGLAIPVYILLFPVYRLNIELGLFGTYWALILPYIAAQLPFNVLLFTGFLADFPVEVEEAAVIDGARLRTLAWQIVFPLMRPVVATLLIFNIIYVWNEYPFAVTLINDPAMTTISLGVAQFQGFWSVDYGAMMASATLVLLPQLLLYAVFQRHVVAGMTFGAVKG